MDARIRWITFGSTLCLLASLGCTQKVYRLELRPDGDQLERTLTVWESVATSEAEKTRPTDNAEIKRLSQIYAMDRPQQDGDKFLFTGKFGNETPADIGGAGRYVRFESPLGDAFVYSERFGSDTDVLGRMQQQYVAIDEFVDLLRGWVESKRDSTPARESLVQMIDIEMRHDLKNLLLTLTIETPTETKQSAADRNLSLATRTMHTLVEAGYLRVHDVPRLMRMWKQEREEAAYAIASLIFSRKCEHAGVTLSPEDLETLTNAEKVQASFNRYLATTADYEKVLADWQAEQGDAANDAEPPAPSSVLTLLFFRVFFPDIQSENARVEVSLELSGPPIETNGEWDQEKQHVAWEGSLNGSVLPMLSFAFWSEAKEDVQAQTLGSVLFSGRALAEYAIWYQGLTQDEQTAWDGHLRARDSDVHLMQHWAAFAFSDDENLSSMPVQILQMVLSEDQ